MPSTAVPSATLGSSGFIAPAESDILTGALADINAAFGGTLNTTNLQTPQGQLASSLSAIVADKNSQFCALANGVDPAFASGRMQDAIARIYFLTRNPAQSTVVQALCTGLPGVVIPVGALATDTSGNVYACTQGASIPAGGSTVTLPFANVATGAVPCPAGTLTTIYRAVPGWDTITNVADGVIGNDVESRSAFEARRSASVEQNSRNTNSAILGSVLAVPGVLDAYVYSNDSAAPIIYGGAAINPNSLYVCVTGGSSAAVAKAIWLKKPPGTGYTGNVNVTVYDDNSGYTAPYPASTVIYQASIPTTIYFSVQIQNGPNVPVDAAAQIQTAIINAFDGVDGGSRARIGSTIYASRYYSSIAALGPWAQIVQVLVGTTTPSGAYVTMSIAQAPVTAAGDITVTVV